MNVLLAYASAHGSTAEIAEKMGEALRSHGLKVVVARVQDVGSIDGYDAFIFGSAIHAGTWMSEMSTFLRRSLKDIGKRPVYFFVTCVRIMELDGNQHVMEFYMIPEILSELNLRHKIAFAGKLALSEVDWNERWTLAARYDGSTWPNNFDGDFRNWDKIDAWTQTVAQDLLQVKTTQ